MPGCSCSIFESSDASSFAEPQHAHHTSLLPTLYCDATIPSTTTSPRHHKLITTTSIPPAISYIYRYSHSPYRTSSPSQHNTVTQTVTQHSPNRHSNSCTDKCGPERGILPLLHCCCSMHLAFFIRVEPTNRTDKASRPSLYKAVLLKVVATWQCLSSKSLILSWLPQGHKKGRPIIALQNTAARLAL